LQATVAEVITDRGAEALEEFVDPDDEELPDLEPAEPAEPRWKKPRDQWEWEEEPRSFNSKAQAIFPEANHSRFKTMSPTDLFDLMFDDSLLTLIATKSNEYSMTKFGTQASITAEDIKVFLAILLLSSYNKVTDYKLYWANSEDTENRMIKTAMARDRLLIIKRCFHLGEDTEFQTDRCVFFTFKICYFCLYNRSQKRGNIFLVNKKYLAEMFRELHVIEGIFCSIPRVQ